ncbi:caldesmon-like [Rhipicephalus sanguineus]|uniref:caldesmon-like n=1 Tax=Rhipicephalus sanguineus TaxID=34632 RepID=UPI001894758B|nr:caldesmon-like [Rhipicephalus sanguineus]
MEKYLVQDLLEICEDLGISTSSAKTKEAILEVMWAENVTVGEADETWEDICEKKRKAKEREMRERRKAEERERREKREAEERERREKREAEERERREERQAQRRREERVHALRMKELHDEIEATKKALLGHITAVKQVDCESQDDKYSARALQDEERKIEERQRREEQDAVRRREEKEFEERERREERQARERREEREHALEMKKLDRDIQAIKWRRAQCQLKIFEIGENIVPFLVKFEKICEDVGVGQDLLERLLALLPCKVASLLERLSAGGAREFDKAKDVLMRHLTVPGPADCESRDVQDSAEDEVRREALAYEARREAQDAAVHHNDQEADFEGQRKGCTREISTPPPIETAQGELADLNCVGTTVGSDAQTPSRSPENQLVEPSQASAKKIECSVLAINCCCAVEVTPQGKELYDHS